MTEAAAFRATYSDWKLIRTRKVVQIVLEVPVELAGEAYNVLGGMPNSGEEIWCAVARLDLTGKESAEKTQPAPKDETVRARKPVAADKRLTQQAGICAGDPVFQEFLYEQNNISSKDEETTAMWIRGACGVESRAEIIPGTQAAKLWDEIYGEFLAWKLAA